ncbi:MAG: hypothetical protein ACLFQE_01765 [Thermotogota bacterium]
MSLRRIREPWDIKEINVEEMEVNITNFVDVDTRKVVFVARGKSADTIKRFKEEYLRKGGKESDIKTLIRWCFAKQKALSSGKISDKLDSTVQGFQDTGDDGSSRNGFESY